MYLPQAIIKSEQKTRRLISFFIPMDRENIHEVQRPEVLKACPFQARTPLKE